MQVTLLHGYPDRIGRRAAWVGVGNGPASYVGGNTPTDQILVGVFQFQIDSVTDISISASGTYYAVAQPSVAGVRATWNLRYFTTATGAEVANGTNLSAQSFVISGFGGFS